MNERYELDPRGDVTDNLRSEYRLLKTEFARQSKTAKARTIKASALWCAFGMALGMTGMVYWYEQQPKPQPVVHVETRMHPTLTDQRVKELRFSLQKLERLKDVHDATLKEAATNQGDIRQMVKALGVKP